MSKTKIIQIILILFSLFLLWIVSSIIIQLGIIPVYSYNTLEELCVAHSNNAFELEEYFKFKNEQMRQNAQARIAGELRPDSISFSMELTNQARDTLMKEYNINPQLSSETFWIVASPEKPNNCVRLDLNTNPKYQESANYYSSIGGSIFWKSGMYMELERQKTIKDCDFIYETINEIDNLAWYVMADSDIQDEIIEVRTAWQNAEKWICPDNKHYQIGNENNKTTKLPEPKSPLEWKTENLLKAHNDLVVFNKEYLPDPVDYGFDLDVGFTDNTKKNEWCGIVLQKQKRMGTLMIALANSLNWLASETDKPLALQERITEDEELKRDMYGQGTNLKKIITDFDC